MLIFSFLSNVDSLDWQDLSATEIINKVCEHKALDVTGQQIPD